MTEAELIKRRRYNATYRSRHPDKIKSFKKRDRERRSSQISESKKHYYRKNADKRRAGHLRRYGISLEQYNTLLKQQGGVCAICKGPHRGRGANFHVDHDHKTNKVRGLLCGWCNSALGYFEDDVPRLNVAISYLNSTL